MAKDAQMTDKKILDIANFCLKQLDEAMREEDPEKAMQKALLAKSIAETLQALRGLEKFPLEYSKLQSQAQPPKKGEDESSEGQEIGFGGKTPDDLV